MSTRLLVASVAIILLASSPASSHEKPFADGDEKFVIKYQIRGRTKNDPAIQAYSNLIDDERKANDELVLLLDRYHNKAGSLYGTPEGDKPLKGETKVVKLRYPKGSPSEIEEVPPEPPIPAKGKPIEIGKPNKPVDVAPNEEQALARLREIFEKARDASKRIADMGGTPTASQVKFANDLINAFNTRLAEFSRIYKKTPEGMSQLPLIKDPQSTPSNKSADPGPPKKPVANGPTLAGKKGDGNFGSIKVRVEFTGSGEKGGFIVLMDGKEVGNGDWILLGTNVSMKSKNWTYGGKIDSDKVSGERKRIIDTGSEKSKGKEESESWSVTFDPPEKLDPYLGTWIYKSAGYTWIFELKERGRGTHTNVPDNGDQGDSGPITWRRSGNLLLYKFRPDGDDWTMNFSDMKKKE